LDAPPPLGCRSQVLTPIVANTENANMTEVSLAALSLGQVCASRAAWGDMCAVCVALAPRFGEGASFSSLAGAGSE